MKTKGNKEEYNINIQSYFKLESDNLFSSTNLNTVLQNLNLSQN